MIEFCPPTAGLREKRVRFESLVSVILIPTRLEFEVAGGGGSLITIFSNQLRHWNCMRMPA